MGKRGGARLRIRLSQRRRLGVTAEPAAPAPARAASSAPAAKFAVNLSVFPDQIQLDTARDYQSFIAVARRPDDITLDVTETASWKLAEEKFARIEGN